MTIRALILSATLALGGCQTATRLVEAPKVQMPANIRTGCDPLPEPPNHGATMGQLYSYTGDVVTLYGECAARDAAKADWAKSQGQ